MKAALAAGEVPDRRVIEAALREIGFTGHQAKCFVGDGHIGLTQRHHDGDADGVLAAIERADAP